MVPRVPNLASACQFQSTTSTTFLVESESERPELVSLTINRPNVKKRTAIAPMRPLSRRANETIAHAKVIIIGKNNSRRGVAKQRTNATAAMLTNRGLRRFVAIAVTLG